jgi:hypothetical protein
LTAFTIGLPQNVSWHRPLLWLAAAMGALTLFALIARFVDPREISGANGWDKPLKFAVSTLIYSVTWSWLIGQLRTARKAASILGDVIAVALFVELVIITGASAIGTTSHYNLTSPLSATLWTVMAFSIVVLWMATFVVSIVLFRNRLGDRARTLAIRLGALIAVLGLGLGFLMTSPTAQQLDDFRGVAGAHTVGIADGGPGLPILGWSTVAGDLRIPHFVGMHALQVIPIALILIEMAARRVAVLRDVGVRSRLVGILSGGYLGALALVTWQSLRGQSIVQPDALTLIAGAAVLAALLGAVGIVLGRATLTARPIAKSRRARLEDSVLG